MKKAIEQRWELGVDQKIKIRDRLLKVLDNSEAGDREVISAAKALMAMESQNQKDEHKVFDAQLRRLNELPSGGSRESVGSISQEDAAGS